MTYTIEQRQYPTYLLTDATRQSVVEIVPERGGIITSWRSQNQELFYLDQARFKDPTLSVRGGIPLLFPICGNVVDDTYTLDGQSYQLKQHGFARTSPWEVTSAADAPGASLTVTLRSNAETLATYPFEFELNYTYTLQGNSLELQFAHTNHSAQPMPFATGIHPYFAVADKSQLAIELPSNQYQVKGDPVLNTFAGQFDFEMDEIDFAFVNLTGQSATVTDKGRNLKLTVEYDANYSTLVFWTVKGKDFYCLEPWTAPRNALNTGKHLLTVAPGATVTTTIRLTAEQI